jgi:hypothetical protein
MRTHTKRVGDSAPRADSPPCSSFREVETIQIRSGTWQRSVSVGKEEMTRCRTAITADRRDCQGLIARLVARGRNVIATVANWNGCSLFPDRVAASAFI